MNENKRKMEENNEENKKIKTIALSFLEKEQKTIENCNEKIAKLEDEMNKIKENRENYIENCLKRLKILQNKKDLEEAHLEADEILTDILTRLGHTEIVEAYEQIGKWYA